MKTGSVSAIVLACTLLLVVGCDTYVADGDESAGINARGGYFYLIDNESDRLVMADQSLAVLGSWPFADFTSEAYVQGITFDGQALWVSVSGGDDSLFQLDLSLADTAVVTRTLPAPPDGQGTVRDIAWDGDVVWVLNSGSETYGNPPEIFQLDALTGEILSRNTLPSGEPRGLCHVGPNEDAYGSGAREGCYYTDKDDDFVYVFETERRIFHDGFAAPVGPRGENYVYPLGIFFDGERFWSTNSSGVADYLFALDYEGDQEQLVEIPYGQPGAIVWIERNLTVPQPPAVIQAVPNTGGRTAEKTVVVTGSGFRDGLTVSLGNGITVDDVTFTDASEIRLEIVIAAGAEFGPRDITVTNPDGQSGVGSNLFSVVENDPALGFLWFADNGNDVVHRYSINDGEVVATFATAPVHSGGSFQGLEHDGTALWMTAGGSDDMVAQIDTVGTLSLVRTLTAPPGGTGTVRGVAFDGTDFWVANSVSDEIYRISHTDGTVLETIAAPALEARGVAWADGRLYCTDRTEDAVFVWDADLAVWTRVFEIPVPPGGTSSNRYPTGMTWDGYSFWICNSTYEFDYIFQVAPDGTLLSTIEVPGRGDAQPTGIVFLQN
ncbi:MAG: hypothetical protein GY838_16685 [bacterium]|nr:hypothetical protein [bacterium]